MWDYREDDDKMMMETKINSFEMYKREVMFGWVDLLGENSVQQEILILLSIFWRNRWIVHGVQPAFSCRDNLLLHS